MDKRNMNILQAFVVFIIVVNIVLLASQINFSDLGYKPNLIFSKDFANDIVRSMQDLAKSFGIEERTTVKQALARLHYDVYLVGNRAELATIIQNNASDARDLIISEYVKTSGEQVLIVLNNDQQVQQTNSRIVIIVEPLPSGGYSVQDPHNLSEGTVTQLTQVPTLFSSDNFRQYFESYRNISTLQVIIEGGNAKLAPPPSDQTTLNYWEKEIQTIRNDYARISRTAGLSEVSGQGISITIHDKLYSVEAGDLRRIVGELYSAGATAISVDGNRLAVNSYIVKLDQETVVDGVKISTNPVVIEALGDHQTLISGIDLLFSVTMKNMFYISTDLHDNIVLPAKTTQ